MTVRTPNLSLFTDAGVEADVAAMQRTAARIRRTAETRFGNAGVLDAEARERGRFGIAGVGPRLSAARLEHGPQGDHFCSAGNVAARLVE